jgi:hypothetical protein
MKLFGVLGSGSRYFMWHVWHAPKISLTAIPAAAASVPDSALSAASILARASLAIMAGSSFFLSTQNA